MITYGEVLADFEDPEQFEVVPADEATEAEVKWHRDSLRQLGSVLRPYLESGVTWYELSPVVARTSRLKKHVREIIAAWPTPAVYVLKAKTRTLYACNPDDGGPDSDGPEGW